VRGKDRAKKSARVCISFSKRAETHLSDGGQGQYTMPLRLEFTNRSPQFSGDSGIGVSSRPAASPNLVSVGGTFFNRDSAGNFVSETYLDGGGDIGPYEPIPSYQNIIKGIVGNRRGYPDVASDFCCAPIYITDEGGWIPVAGTSWSSPTFAGIVNAAGSKKKSTHDELIAIYREYANKKQYRADFRDITSGDSQCAKGWDLCAGVGSAITYRGK
jgi:subtilase family serine protease